jgi:hypothetical protein
VCSWNWAATTSAIATASMTFTRIPGWETAVRRGSTLVDGSPGRVNGSAGKACRCVQDLRGLITNQEQHRQRGRLPVIPGLLRYCPVTAGWRRPAYAPGRRWHSSARL